MFDRNFPLNVDYSYMYLYSDSEYTRYRFYVDMAAGLVPSMFSKHCLPQLIPSMLRENLLVSKFTPIYK